MEIPEEPKRFREDMLKHGWEMETDEYISWKLKKEHIDNFNSVPEDKRNEILKTFRKGGISIGEVAEKYGLDTMVVADIITFNISQAHYLNQESVE